MYICVCHAVTDSQIREAAHRGCRSFAELRDELQVGTCCGRCSGCARRVLHAAIGDRRSLPTPNMTIVDPLLPGCGTPQPAAA